MSIDIKKTTKIEKNNEELKTSNFFAKKILDLLENNSDLEQDFLYEDFGKYFEKLIEKFLNSWVKKHNFLEKYFSEENWNKKLNWKFKEKFNRYFNIHKNIFLESLKKDIEKLEWEKNELQIQNIFKNNVKKYIQILFIFWEKIKPSFLQELLEKDLEEINDIFTANDNKLQALWNFWSDWINPISTYRTILSKRISQKNPEEIGEKLEIEKLFKEQVFFLYEIFYKWKKTPFVKEEDLKIIQKTSLEIFDLVLDFKKANIAFSSNFYVSNLKNPQTKKIFINDFIKNFVETNITAWKNIRQENIDLFKKFLEISILDWDFSSMIDEIKIYKKNKYKKEIPEKKELVWEKKLEEIKNKVNLIDFKEYYKLPDIQQYEIFFQKVLYKKDDKLVLNTKLLEIEIIKDEDVKNFSELVNSKEQIVKNQLENIKNNLGKVNSIKEFNSRDINDLNLLLAWFDFILKKKTLEKKDKEINLENLQKIEDKPYWVVNRIVKKLDWKVDDLEFLPWWDRLVNDSAKNIEKLCHDLKIRFEKWPIDINREFEIWEKKQKFKNFSSIYIQESLEETLENNKKTLLVCNKLLSREKIENEKEKEILEKLQNIWIVPENLENLDLKYLDILAELKEFLKYVNYNAKILNDMLDTWEEDKKILKGFLPENNENEYTWIWWTKTFSRALEKLIKDYNWDFAKLWDLTRMRITNDWIEDTINSVVNFIKKANKNENISQIAIIDYTQNPLEKPKKNSWYRDIKLLVKFQNWNVWEVQFQYTSMIKMKEEGLDLEEEKNNFIFKKFIEETGGFSEDEIKQIISFAKRREIQIPKKEILEKLISSNFEIEEENEIMTKTQISTQDTYNISRIFEWDEQKKELRKKLSRFERILADIAWWETVNIYLENILDTKKIKLN